MKISAVSFPPDPNTQMYWDYWTLCNCTHIKFPNISLKRRDYDCFLDKGLKEDIK